MKKVFAILLFAVLLGLGFLAWASQSAPGWYAPVDPYDPDVSTLAETVEYRVAEELTKVRADEEPWALRVRDEQVNAWLASRLPEWVAHDGGRGWPDEVGGDVELDKGRTEKDGRKPMKDFVDDDHHPPKHHLEHRRD